MGRDGWTRSSAGLGCGVVLGLLACRGAEGLDLIVPLFLLAPLVLVPLGLALLDRRELAPGALRLGRRGQPLGAAGATLSFLFPIGPVAGAFAAAWGVVAIALAAHGLGRAWRRRAWDPTELCFDAGLVALPVGAMWLVFSRLGTNPLGFGEPIVLLTAVHFHYAGFAALVLAGLAGRAVASRSGWPRILHAAAAWGTLAGTPLLAAGITLSPGLELLGAAILVASLLGLSVVVLGAVLPARRMSSGCVLLTVSSASVWLAMAVAGVYAWGEFQGMPMLGLITVARVHGAANALGFALCGLLGHTLQPPSSGA